MNPLSLIFAAARSGAHKSGAVSAAETIPGGLAAYAAIVLAKKSGTALSMEEVFAVYMAGPAISSYLLGTLRKIILDVLKFYKDITTDFQRGTSEPSPTEAPK